MDLSALDAAHAAAVPYLQNVSSRPVGSNADAASMRAALGGPLPEHGEPPGRVVEELARRADPGIVATGGPRFFGFVIGGSVPAAVGAVPIFFEERNHAKGTLDSRSSRVRRPGR